MSELDQEKIVMLYAFTATRGNQFARTRLTNGVSPAPDRASRSKRAARRRGRGGVR